MKEFTNNQMPDNRKRLLTGLLLLFCAIPGLVLFLICSMFLLGFFIDPTPATPSPIWSIPGAVIGMLLILTGTGQLKHWAYSLVFLSIPTSVIAFALVVPKSLIEMLEPIVGNKLGPVIIAGGSAFLTYHLVHRIYRRKKDHL
jgi:hypothetical protein